MAAAAEQIIQKQPSLASTEELEGLFASPAYGEPAAVAVPEMAEDPAVCLRAARFIVGATTECNPIDTTETIRPIESLYDAIQKAAEGDHEARQMIETNVRTDVIERTMKTGHVIKVDLHVNEAGKILQHGQTMESVQANSLRYASSNWQMRERTEAETLNSFRIEQLQRQGKLRDHSFVVFSRAADNMTEAEMKETGFFTETMSCAIQVTTAEDGILTTESAFVSGVKKTGGERHDAETIVALAARFGVDLSGMSATEVLATPLLIHNSLLKNGAIDLVSAYDNCAGATFFGEDREQQEYLAYRRQCDEREEQLQPKVDAIVNELIAEADSIHSRVEAVQRLHKLSEKHMVQQAVFDDSIDLRVFGNRAQAHILHARNLFEQGLYEQGLAQVSRAVRTAQSNSCPTGLSGTAEQEAGADSKATDETCSFVSKKCPECGDKNVWTTVTTTYIKGSCGCFKRK